MYWLEWKFISLHLNHEDALLVGVPKCIELLPCW